MKKLQFRFMVFLSLLAMLASIAAAPMPGAVISLLETRNDARGGVIFVFSVSGKFTKAELNNGSVQVDGESYGLHCNQVNEETVQCSTSKKVGGKNVKVIFGGSIFWPFVPPASGGAQYCYGV